MTEARRRERPWQRRAQALIVVVLALVALAAGLALWALSERAQLQRERTSLVVPHSIAPAPGLGPRTLTAS